MSTLVPRRRYDTSCFKRVTLSNGVPLFIQRPPLLVDDAGVIIIGINNAGARQDPSGKEGAAHYMEHIPPRSTQRFPKTGEAGEYINSYGGVLNAETSLGRMWFHITAPQEALHASLETLRQIVFHASFEESHVVTERGVILGEIREKEASSRWPCLERELWTHAFGLGNRFSIDPLGTPASVATITVDDLRSFYENYFVTANMVVFVGGAFTEHPDVSEQVDAAFGDTALRRGNVAYLPPVDATSFFDEGVVEIAGPQVPQDCYVRHTLFARGNMTPELDAALTLLWATTSAGTFSPFMREMRGRLGAAYRLGSLGLMSQSDFVLRGFSIVAERKHFETIDALYRTVLAGITPSQVRAAQQATQRGRCRLFTTPGVATYRAWDEFHMVGYVSNIREDEEIFDALTFEDVCSARDHLLSSPCRVFHCFKD